jgi:lipoprotein-anchoring transpeptidase ErfK/SrfK
VKTGRAREPGRSPRSTRTTLLVVTAFCIAVGGVLIGLNAGHRARPTSTATPPVATTAPATAPPASLPAPGRTTPAPLAAPGTTLVAALRVATPSFVSPGGAPRGTIAPTWLGSPAVLPVIARRGGDLEVRLPTRPNGSTTWIRRAGVRLYATPYRIVVNLTSRRLSLYRANVLVLTAPAGIGTPVDPTPVGHFFVAFFARAPSAAWGPFIMVTSAHSTAIADWEGTGDAVVAIHGPLGDASLIGSSGARLSHGCVRLLVNDLARLRSVPDGSPVDIVA